MSQSKRERAERCCRIEPRWIVMACALIALIAKLYCACTTIGTTDTFLFHMFGKTIAADGLMAMYRATALFNHTPIVGEFAAAAWRLEQATGIGFPLYIRVPGILADFLSVFLLVWLRERTGRPAWWAIGLFALSPVSFMIAGYHGNVDAVLAGLLLFATCCCVAPRPLACGILLGLACNVKIVALLLSPVLFFYWAHRSRALPFTLGAIVTTLIGWAAPLAVLPQTFLRNVLGYGGYWGDWGITYLLGRSGWSEFQQNGFLELSSAQHIVFSVLKVIIFSLVMFLAWRRRAADPLGLFATLALAWVVMFVFSPGGAPQYLIWLAPFILLYSQRWYLALTATSTIFLFVFYNAVSHGMPWYRGLSTEGLAPLWRPWTLLPWIVLVALLAIRGWAESKLPALPAAKTPSTPSPV